MDALPNCDAVRCRAAACEASAYNISEALIRRWEWSQDEQGRICWLCRPCFTEHNAEGA